MEPPDCRPGCHFPTARRVHSIHWRGRGAKAFDEGPLVSGYDARPVSCFGASARIRNKANTWRKKIPGIFVRLNTWVTPEDRQRWLTGSSVIR